MENKSKINKIKIFLLSKSKTKNSKLNKILLN